MRLHLGIYQPLDRSIWTGGSRAQYLNPLQPKAGKIRVFSRPQIQSILPDIFRKKRIVDCTGMGTHPRTNWCLFDCMFEIITTTIVG